MYRRSLQIQRRVLGENHQDVARSLDHTAITLGDQGKHGEARKMFGEALAVYTSAFGIDNHENTRMHAETLSGGSSTPRNLTKGRKEVENRLVHLGWRYFYDRMHPLSLAHRIASITSLYQPNKNTSTKE